MTKFKIAPDATTTYPDYVLKKEEKTTHEGQDYTLRTYQKAYSWQNRFSLSWKLFVEVLLSLGSKLCAEHTMRQWKKIREGKIDKLILFPLPINPKPAPQNLNFQQTMEAEIAKRNPQLAKQFAQQAGKASPPIAPTPAVLACPAPVLPPKLMPPLQNVNPKIDTKKEEKITPKNQPPLIPPVVPPTAPLPPQTLTPTPLVTPVKATNPPLVNQPIVHASTSTDNNDLDARLKRMQAALAEVDRIEFEKIKLPSVITTKILDIATQKEEEVRIAPTNSPRSYELILPETRTVVGQISLVLKDDYVFINWLEAKLSGKYQRIGTALHEFAIRLSFENGLDGHVQLEAQKGSAGFHFKMGYRFLKERSLNLRQKDYDILEPLGKKYLTHPSVELEQEIRNHSLFPKLEQAATKKLKRDPTDFKELVEKGLYTDPNPSLYKKYYNADGTKKVDAPLKLTKEGFMYLCDETRLDWKQKLGL